MTLKEIRKKKKLTQADCAKYLGVGLRTYQIYESDKSKVATFKYEYMTEKLMKYIPLDEEHGILTLDDIKEKCANVFKDFDVKYCYLFGSYAKGNPAPTSDVDLLIDSPVTGMQFFELCEVLRETLQKKVDLLNTEQLKSNHGLVTEILKDGIKIYG